MIFELIAEFIGEVFIIDLLGGLITRINNFFLKLRGIEAKSIEEVKYDKLRKRYEYKNVKLKRQIDSLKKGTLGVVVEVINNEFCFVEFGTSEKIILKLKLKDLLLSK